MAKTNTGLMWEAWMGAAITTLLVLGLGGWRAVDQSLSVRTGGDPADKTDHGQMVLN